MNTGDACAVRGEIPGTSMIAIFIAFEGTYARVIVHDDETHEDRELVVYRRRILPIPPIQEA